MRLIFEVLANQKIKGYTERYKAEQKMDREGPRELVKEDESERVSDVTETDENEIGQILLKQKLSNRCLNKIGRPKPFTYLRLLQ